MRNWLGILIGIGVCSFYWTHSALSERDDDPHWAWGFTSSASAPQTAPSSTTAPAPLDDKTLLSLPGSNFQFTEAEVSDRYAPADWFPNDHPPMPEIVAHGRQTAGPPIMACSLCHMPNGKGRPENANLTGLSYEYIVQQLIDFRKGLRQTSDTRKTNTALMEDFAKAMTEAEIKESARYFSSIPATPWVSVVESKTVPKTRTDGGVFFAMKGLEAGLEPLGERIIEMPISNSDFEARNPRSGFIAYVPPGSIKKGEELVMTGAGKVTPCVACHGYDLRGLGPIPPLAGRSPSYLVRQMYDMQLGNRTGLWSPLMAAVLGNLDQSDLLVAAAYLASLEP
jgi:cytochrome c553